MKFTTRKHVQADGRSSQASAEAEGACVANDLWPNPARSAAGPPPTKDTQEPRGKGLSMGKGRGKGVHKSGQGGRKLVDRL